MLVITKGRAYLFIVLSHGNMNKAIGQFLMDFLTKLLDLSGNAIAAGAKSRLV